MKFLAKIFPMFFIRFLIKHKYSNKHRFLESTLIHRNQGTVLFEVEFNWYDKDLQPITVVRAVRGGQISSISVEEIHEFKEYEGRDRNAGTVI